MGWIYLAEGDGSLKPWRHGSALSPTVKTTISLKECCYHACIDEKFQPPQSGPTLELFEEECCQCQSTAFGEDFHAKDTALQELVNEWRIAARSFSGKLSGWQKKRNRRSFFLKMSGRGLDGLYQRSELRLRELGSKCETGTWRHPMSAYRTDGKGFSYLPTPTVTEGGYNLGGGAGRRGKVRWSLAQLWRRGLIPTPCARDSRAAGYASELKRNSPHLPALWIETTGTQLPPSFVEWIMGSRIGASALESWAIPSRGFSTAKRLKD